MRWAVSIMSAPELRLLLGAIANVNVFRTLSNDKHESKTAELMDPLKKDDFTAIWIAKRHDLKKDPKNAKVILWLHGITHHDFLM
jgi:hypothetical protein